MKSFFSQGMSYCLCGVVNGLLHYVEIIVYVLLYFLVCIVLVLNPFLKLEIRDSQYFAKLGQRCTAKLSDGGGEGIEFLV